MPRQRSASTSTHSTVSPWHSRSYGDEPSGPGDGGPSPPPSPAFEDPPEDATRPALEPPAPFAELPSVDATRPARPPLFPPEPPEPPVPPVPPVDATRPAT